MKRYQVFISHSSKDEILIDLILLAFENSQITPFFAKREMAGKNPAEKVIEAIDKSYAFFILMTSSVVEDSDTRDWVVFETGVGKVKGKPIFCWMDQNVAENAFFPQLIRYLTDYSKFNSGNHHECTEVARKMLSKALEIRGQEGAAPKAKQLQKGLSQIQKGKEFVINFVMQKLNSKDVNVDRTEIEDDTYIFNGSAITNLGSSSWMVKIKDGQVISFDEIEIFEAEILGKKRFNLGETIFTRVRYKGTLRNGFFDNQIILPNGKHQWSWAPDTLKDSHPDIPGDLKGTIDHVSKWGWIIPRKGLTGTYTFIIRVFEHLGSGNRPVIKEKRETIVVE